MKTIAICLTFCHKMTGLTRDLLDAGSLGVTADGEDPAIGASVDNALVDLGRRRLTGTKPSSSLSADSRRTDNDKDDRDLSICCFMHCNSVMTELLTGSLPLMECWLCTALWLPLVPLYDINSFFCSSTSLVSFLISDFWVVSHFLILTFSLFFLSISVSNKAIVFLRDAISSNASLNCCLTAVNRVPPRRLTGAVGSSSLGTDGELALRETGWVGLVPGRESWLLSEAIISSRLGPGIWLKLGSQSDILDVPDFLEFLSLNTSNSM